MNILIASPIDPDAIERLRRQHDVVCVFNASEPELCRHIADREIVIFHSGVGITSQAMACAPNLRLLIRAGSGSDNIDRDYVLKHDLKLIHIPQPGARAVAELTFALMLALARQVPLADRLLRRGCWAQYDLVGHSVVGKTLGIVGAGTVGACVGQLGAAWGMDVVGCVGHPSRETANRLSRKHIHLVGFSEVLSAADFLSIHVPLNAQTQNLIDADALRLMKPGAYLLNMAQGGVVDEGALRRALLDGRLAGAALDVHQREGAGSISPLAGLSNAILTPHIGSMTAEVQREVGRRIICAINAAADVLMGASPVTTE